MFHSTRSCHRLKWHWGGMPVLGNNIYIGAGAKIIGNIYIADDCVIGANAVVTKSIMEPKSIVAGIPAKVIGKKTKNYC